MSPDRPLRIVTLTEMGLATAERLQQALGDGDCEIWFRPKPFVETVQSAFAQGGALLFICATGIVVRTLAPVLGNKHDDPPVLVLDEAGRFVIPLLSGHEGGANDLASTVAERLSAQLVVTTAARYIAPVYAVGMGCERGCPADHLRALLDDALRDAALRVEDVSGIASIRLKADEQGLIDMARSLDIPFETYGQPDLAAVESLLSTRSDYIYRTVGVYGVAESAALVAATAITGADSELLLPKIKTGKATCAIARSYPEERVQRHE